MTKYGSIWSFVMNSPPANIKSRKVFMGILPSDILHLIIVCNNCLAVYKSLIAPPPNHSIWWNELSWDILPPPNFSFLYWRNSGNCFLLAWRGDMVFACVCLGFHQPLPLSFSPKQPNISMRFPLQQISTNKNHSVVFFSFKINQIVGYLFF